MRLTNFIFIGVFLSFNFLLAFRHHEDKSGGRGPFRLLDLSLLNFSVILSRSRQNGTNHFFFANPARRCL